MKVQVRRSLLKGTLQVPASKSAMQRACAAALLTNGETTLFNPGISNDDKAALAIIEQLGANVKIADQTILIQSEGIHSIRQSKHDTIDCGESGLSVRMFTPIAALNGRPIKIVGHGSLRSRPMHFFEEILPALDVVIMSQHTCIPLIVKGPLTAKNIQVDGSQSSQYITGLLMAYATAATQECTINVENLTSKPYVELTLSIMQHFHMNVPEVSRLEAFRFQAAVVQESQSVSYHVESDWSSASFFLVGAAIHGNLVLEGLNSFSTQADAAILEVLADAGADLSIDENDTIYIQQSDLHAFIFDATDCPDLFPPLVVLASFCKGTSQIKGANRLIHKESNRKESLEEEFSKIGVIVYTKEDIMYIEGADSIKGTEVSAHNDHRIAMALAIAGLRCEGVMEITGAESVNKSYPEFWEDLKKMGGEVNV